MSTFTSTTTTTTTGTTTTTAAAHNLLLANRPKFDFHKKLHFCQNEETGFCTTVETSKTCETRKLLLAAVEKIFRRTEKVWEKENERGKEGVCVIERDSESGIEPPSREAYSGINVTRCWNKK